MIKSSGSWAEPPMSAHISTSVTFRVPLGRPFWYLDYALYPLAKARGLTAYYDKANNTLLFQSIHPGKKIKKTGGAGLPVPKQRTASG